MHLNGLSPSCPNSSTNIVFPQFINLQFSPYPTESEILVATHSFQCTSNVDIQELSENIGQRFLLQIPISCDSCSVRNTPDMEYLYPCMAHRCISFVLPHPVQQLHQHGLLRLPWYQFVQDIRCNIDHPLNSLVPSSPPDWTMAGRMYTFRARLLILGCISLVLLYSFHQLHQHAIFSLVRPHPVQKLYQHGLLRLHWS